MTIWKKDNVEEAKKQLWLAMPMSMVRLFQFGITVISLIFVGHLGKLALSGASLATSFANVTGFNVLIGMAGALDTLCGQSFGATQHHMLGIHLQRATFVLLVVGIFLAIIWIFTKDILVAIHQELSIAEEAGTYARFMIPSLFAYAILQCLLKFLQTQNIVFPILLSSALTAILHILICWILVFKSSLGSKGAAIANSISYWVNVILIALYVRFSSSCQRSWTGFSKKAFQNVPNFLNISIPSTIMLCLKGWTFEIMVLLSGHLPNPKLETSVLSICRNTFGIVWIIPFGFSAAVSTRVSNELGAGHLEAIILAIRVAMFMVFIESIILALVMILLRNLWGKLYSNEIDVIKSFASLMPILAASCFLDGIQSVLSGIARGSGWQKMGAYVNLGAFYLVGLPCGVVLAFIVHMKGKGLWLGVVCALIVQVTLFGIITVRTNWEKEANKAVKRVGSTRIPQQS